MADLDNTEVTGADEQDTEIEVEPEVSVNSMIDKIIDGENAAAKLDFEALITNKLNAALDQKKQELAQSIYADNTEQDTGEEEVEQEEQEA